MEATPAELERPEVAGWHDFRLAVPPAVAGAYGVVTREIAGASCGSVEAFSGQRMFCHVFGLGLDADAGDDVLDEVEAYYAGLAVDYSVAVSPAARPADLADRLAARGFSESYAWTKFRRGPEPAPRVETDLAIEEVGTAHRQAFGELVTAAFDLPPGLAPWTGAVVGRDGWTCLMAFDGDEPAAAAALYVDGDAGWLSFGATSPDHRRRGAQSALLAARIEEGRRRGLRLLVTETGAPVDGRPGNSYRNILRAGFEEVYVRPNLASPGR